ncbi:MAG: tRNA (guanosine(46)-N7)-methyltransferase TrmB [Bacteroidetes bacterium]|nr:tRNA (guanosine(46)-N7)-methyltransferase TrmB [Bacteroidota bacterium]
MQGKKLQRFAELNTFSNVFQYPENIQARWTEIFGNNHPIILELACGKGEYTVNMAKAFPDKNFIGIDVKGNRMYIGAKKALQEGIKNVAFLRIRIEQIIAYFNANQVAEIWITFPDPFLRESKAKNRLTHHKFLKMYQQILEKNGKMHLKTDSKPLFDFTIEMVEHHQCHIIEKIDDVHKNGEPAFPLSILTFYEKQHLLDHRTIQYICFNLPEKEIIVPPKKKLNEESII